MTHPSPIELAPVHTGPARATRPAAPSRQAHRGFALLDTLVALLVTALGALALLGLQSALTRDTDLARQRSEATRLAQARMEAMRAAVGLGAGVAGARNAWERLPLAPETTVAGPTSFQLVAALSGEAAEPLRAATVSVRWLDRTGGSSTRDADGLDFNQEVRLASVIAAGDPALAGRLGNPLPAEALLRRPANRHLAIPAGALTLGQGRSAVQLAADHVAVLDDASGELLQVCNPAITEVSVDRIRAMLEAGACSALKGLVVAGHISRSGADVPWPRGIATGELLRQNPAPGWAVRCRVWAGDDPAATTGSGTGGTLAPATPSASPTEAYGSQYYLCVIPLQAPHAWSGTLRLAGVPTDGDLVVCRHQLETATLAPNERHVQPYAQVQRSLRGQNYLVARAPDGRCPASMALEWVSTGVLHQDCRSGAAGGTGIASACPAP